MPYTFGYWDCKGLGHPIKQLLILLGEDFEEGLWSTPEQWIAKKNEVFKGEENNALLQCPYLVDGDLIVTESTAIPYYLCQKANRGDLLGKNLVDQTRVRQLQGLAHDLYLSTRVHFVIEDRDETAEEAQVRKEKLKETAVEGGKTHTLAQRLSEYLGEKEFLLGYFTYADLAVTHFIQQNREACLSSGAEDPYAGFPNLIALRKRVLALPELKDVDESHPHFPGGWKSWTWWKTQPLPE